eukprot:CAMPEP_0176447920 /NCGR_PEP_ID=MMETSP0127-20121128/25395_1 /TAXON_ID=938130 /ORGANISM="Platyophrya macrostoma, Strain WH" /LENGTH=173 /DNA_ID=CAMNT_0017834611 /DNA_START=53 /DNA_END=574 /DNA_ORIENTATION=+
MMKVLPLGDSGVGKSSLIIRITDDTFSESYISTIGVDFKLKTLELEGQNIKFQLWDTAGQERFGTITAPYYKGAKIIILVFDLTDADSFKDLAGWHKQVQDNTTEGVKLLLVGNKLDLESKRAVTKEEAIKFAEEIGAGYLEVSAKEGKNISEILPTGAKYVLGTRDPSEDRK